MTAYAARSPSSSEGAAPAEPDDLDDDAIATLVESAVASGLSRKDAVSEVATSTGLPRKQVYAAATPPLRWLSLSNHR